MRLGQSELLRGSVSRVLPGRPRTRFRVAVPGPLLTELLAFLSAVLAASARLSRAGVGGWRARGLRDGTFRIQRRLPTHAGTGLSPSGSAGNPGRQRCSVCILRGLPGAAAVPGSGEALPRVWPEAGAGQLGLAPGLCLVPTAPFCELGCLGHVDWACPGWLWRGASSHAGASQPVRLSPRAAGFCVLYFLWARGPRRRAGSQVCLPSAPSQPPHCACSRVCVYFQYFLRIHLRARAPARVGGADGERTPGRLRADCRARRGAQSRDPEITTRPEAQSRRLHSLSPPGALWLFKQLY